LRKVIAAFFGAVATAGFHAKIGVSHGFGLDSSDTVRLLRMDFSRGGLAGMLILAAFAGFGCVLEKPLSLFSCRTGQLSSVPDAVAPAGNQL